jgi:hypothetical protein
MKLLDEPLTGSDGSGNGKLTSHPGQLPARADASRLPAGPVLRRRPQAGPSIISPLLLRRSLADTGPTLAKAKTQKTPRTAKHAYGLEYAFQLQHDYFVSLAMTGRPEAVLR